MKVEVTKKDFDKYVEVQNSGKFNMLEPKALAATGLKKSVYFEIIANYSRLKSKFYGG